MAGRLKHMERSHYSYKHNNEAVFVGFENKARVKTAQKAQKAQKSGFLAQVGASIRKMFHREQSR